MIEPLSFNPFEKFIGKTIKDLKYFKGWCEIAFEDGTDGYIDISVPEGTPRNKVFLGGRLNDGSPLPS